MTGNTKHDSSNKNQPVWTAPVILSIIMLSSGAFTLMLAHAIEIFSRI